MPTGPKGQKRPADAIGNAIRIARIATGDEEETPESPQRAGGLKGGKARADNLSDQEKSKIAQKGAAARWDKAKDNG